MLHFDFMVFSPTGKAAALEQTWMTLSRVIAGPTLSARISERSGIELHRGALMALWRLVTDGPQLISDLAARAGVDVSTMSRLLRQLERDGLVVRERDVGDLRRVEVRITDQGREAHERVSAAATAILDEVVAEWTEEDCAAFICHLERFTAGLINHLEHPAEGKQGT